jgi:Flp pilus assembly protein TadB
MQSVGNIARQGVQEARGVAQSFQQPQQYAQPQQQQQGMSGVRKGAIVFSLMSGLFPFPLNPIFLPIQMTIFIIMIIVLLFKGYSFWTAALLSWLIPGLIAAVIHYMVLGGALSIMGMGVGDTV